MSSPCLARVHSRLPLDARQRTAFRLCDGEETTSCHQLSVSGLARHRTQARVFLLSEWHDVACLPCQGGMLIMMLRD